MRYYVKIREDADGNDITFNRDAVSYHSAESLKQYEENAALVLNSDSTLSLLFQ